MGRSGSFQAPPGFRDSSTRVLNQGDVVASAYTVRNEIARTDTGVVYEARDMMIDRLVALKLAWRGPGLPSLILEARRCASVRESCAVAIYGMGNYQGTEFVVGERVTGRMLAHVVTQELLPADCLARFRKLVAAVARAHEAGIPVGDLWGPTSPAEPVARAPWPASAESPHEATSLGRASHRAREVAADPTGRATPEPV